MKPVFAAIVFRLAMLANVQDHRKRITP